MGSELRKNDEGLADHIRLLNETKSRKAAEKAQKAAEEKARWDEYHEQLAKGNSNIGSGAKHKRLRGRIFRFR